MISTPRQGGRVSRIAAVTRTSLVRRRATLLMLKEEEEEKTVAIDIQKRRARPRVLFDTGWKEKA